MLRHREKLSVKLGVERYMLYYSIFGIDEATRVINVQKLISYI